MSNFSPGSEGSGLRQNVPDSRPGSCASTTPIADECSLNTGPESPSSPTCATSQGTLFGTPATAARPSSPVVSRANRSQVLESARELVTTAFYGRSSAASFASRAPDGSWERTSEGSLASLMGESSVEFSATWPTWGTASDGLATALTKPVERPTAGTGCSSSGTWPTPRSCPGDHASGEAAATRAASTCSDIQAQAQTWPTPDSVPDAPNTGSNSVNVVPGLGNRAQQWPTPRAAELDGRGNAKRKPGTGGKMLDEECTSFPQAPATSKPGTDYCSLIRSLLQRSPGKRRLNADFVQKVMGFPEGWLD